jgi:hypothetical protein
LSDAGLSVNRAMIFRTKPLAQDAAIFQHFSPQKTKINVKIQ